jgi:hypothetical protein
MRLRNIILAVTVSLMLSIPMPAGTLEISVLDPVGASLPKARIVLIDSRSLRVRTYVADNSGKLMLTGIEDQEYEVVWVSPASALCFQPVVSHVDLRKGGKRELRARLRINLDKCGEPIE